jgi:hypothetical protein
MPTNDHRPPRTTVPVPLLPSNALAVELPYLVCSGCIVGHSENVRPSWLSFMTVLVSPRAFKQSGLGRTRSWGHGRDRRVTGGIRQHPGMSAALEPDQCTSSASTHGTAIERSPDRTTRFAISLV